MTLSPKDDFRKSPHGKNWNDVVDSDQFQAATKAAWIQFTMEPERDRFQLEGARIFLSRLMSLCEETPKPTASTISPQLKRT